MKRVGEVPRSSLAGGALVRLAYPPYDVLVAEVDGMVCAIEDSCNHAGASLCGGTRQGAHGVVCPMHDYVFDLRTGELLVPKRACDAQRVFHVTIEGDAVVVWDPVSVSIMR